MFWCVCRELGLVWGSLNRETVSWKQCVFPVLPSQQSFWTFKAENHDLYKKGLLELPQIGVGLRWRRWNQLYLSRYFWVSHFHVFKLHSTHNIFCYVNNITGLPWAIYHTKKAFLLFVAKTRWNQLYSIKSIFWLVCRKIVSLPALLHLEKVFFQFAASHPGFLLHFTQNNVFTCVWLSDAVLESSFWEQPLPLFS